MEVIFYGVRGSLPVPSPLTARYGGNTSCLAVRGEAGELLILDGGSGLRTLGGLLPEAGVCDLFLTHLHLDHLMGLPFFLPLYRPGWTINLRVPVGGEDVLERLMDGVLFPLRPGELAATVNILPCADGGSFALGRLEAEAVALPHPGGNLGLRVRGYGRSLAFSGDCELGMAVPGSGEKGLRAAARLLTGMELAVVDGQYAPEQYARHHGWGHSACEDWLPLARRAGVRELLFTHHDMDSDDMWLETRAEKLDDLAKALPFHLNLAYEGMTL